MKTKKDILKILEKNPHGWCEKEVKKAIEYVKQFQDDATIEKIAKGIPQEWALYWARDIGDIEIMCDRIVDDEYMFYWICWIKDEEVMQKRIKNKSWLTRLIWDWA